MNAFLQTLRNLGPMRLAAIAIVTFSLLGFFAFLTTRISSSPMSLLYTELDQQDAGSIVQKLDTLKIPYEVAPSGGAIRVPADQVGKVRMLMAADGLPKGGSIGYEIFDQKEGFGTTSFVQNVNHLRALEGELARTISTMTTVQSARVHLVLPQRELFSHNTQAATASIFIKTRGGAVLAREQIAAIQHLIAAAVPQLQPNQISIVDDKGNLLARPSGDGGMASNSDDMRIVYEQAQVRKIEELLAQTLGAGKVRAQVSAELDFDRITTNSEIFDPESQVVRSTQSVNEEAKNSEGGNDAVTVSNNLPGNQPVGSGAGGAGGNKSNRSEETVNYEINKTIRNQVRESGQVKRLSVAVVVDGSTTTAADGTQAYQARTPEEMEQIKSLVRSAVNLDATRGDTLEVANMKFAQPEVDKGESSATDVLMGVPKSELMHIAQTLILALIGLLVVLLIVRPMMKRLLDMTPMSSSGGDGQHYISSSYGGEQTGRLPAPGGAMSQSLAAQDEDEESEVEKMIDISQVEGRVKASSVRKVGEIVEKHPEEAISILRNWIYQENR